MAMQRGSAARLRELGEVLGVAWCASCGWMPAVAKICGCCVGASLERAVHGVRAVADADGEQRGDAGGRGVGEDRGRSS